MVRGRNTEEIRLLCTLYLLSDTYKNKKKKAKEYITTRIAYSTPGSNFDHSVGRLKYLFRIPGVNGVITATGIWYLLGKGYDALLLDMQDKIIGHTAYQIHPDNSLHIFSVEIDQGYRTQGLAQLMVEETLNIARAKGMQKMRIGGGNNEATNRIHARFAENAEDLGVIVREANWVDIL